MKATIDFDPALYQRLKVEAARRGQTVKELVAQGVRVVLAAPPPPADTPSAAAPAWLAGLHRYAKNARGRHDMGAVRASIAGGRAKPE